MIRCDPLLMHSTILLTAQVLALNKQLRAAMRTLDEEDLVEVAQKVRL